MTMQGLDGVGSPQAAISLWISSRVGFAAFGICATWLWARRFDQLQKQGRRRLLILDLARVASVLVTVAILGFGVISLGNSALQYRVLTARHAFSTYRYNVDVASGNITISGPIGPGMSERLRTTLDTLTHIRSVTISSPGGLVDEALEFASILQKHPEVSVIAHRECNSACLIVLMAPRERQADWNMSLGFHAVSAITHLPSSELNAITQLGASSDRYLISRGIPVDVVRRSDEAGPDRLYDVSAIRLARMGVNLTLLFDDKPISLKAAEWMSVEQALIRDASPALPLFNAIGETAPAIVSQYADALFDAAHDSDGSRVSVIVRQLMGQLEPLVIDASGTAEVYSYLEDLSAQVDYLARIDAWRSCSDYADGHGGGAVRDVSQSLLKQELRDLSMAVRSAAQTGWQKRPIPPWAADASNRAVQLAASDLRAARLSLDDVQTDPRVKCLWTDALFQELIRMGPIQGTMAYRSLADQP